jgi:hypothetical protein
MCYIPEDRSLQIFKCLTDVKFVTEQNDRLSNAPDQPDTSVEQQKAFALTTITMEYRKNVRTQGNWFAVKHKRWKIGVRIGCRII